VLPTPNKSNAVFVTFCKHIVPQTLLGKLLVQRWYCSSSNVRLSHQLMSFLSSSISTNYGYVMPDLRPDERFPQVSNSNVAQLQS